MKNILQNDTLEVAANSGEWEVQTPSGWKAFRGVRKLKKKQLYKVTTKSGNHVLCTANHSFIDAEGEAIPCRHSLNKLIRTTDGNDEVVSITKGKKDYVYDLVDVEDGSVFYANGILHHNTHLLEEFWKSVIPSISSGKTSKILMVSTPHGASGKFYEIYSGAERGKLKEWKAERVDWWEVPGRDEEWKKTMIEVLGSEESFNQEFGNCFLDDATQAVGAAVIERFKREKLPPIWVSDDGEYQIFENPTKGNLYVIGVDVGEGIGQASSVAQVLDVSDLQDIRQVAVYGSNIIEPFHFANKLNTLGHSWGLPPILIERNNCGAQVIDALYHQCAYEKIVSYNKISEQDKYNRTRNLGVLSHTNIRFDGVQNMRYWVNHLQCVKINDPTTISEFETFVRSANGVFKKRGDNFFDDRIMALVWALFILEPETCQQYFTIAEYDDQNRPQRVTSNGYWEEHNDNYLLRDLSKRENIIVTNHRGEYSSVEAASAPSTLGFTESDLFYSADADKYGLDAEALAEQGYEFFMPNE